MTSNPYIPRGWHSIQRILRFLIRLVMKLEVRGEEFLPRQGPAIVTSNHTSWIDVVLMMAYCRVPPVTLAAEKWERVPVINRLMLHFGQAIFVNRGEVDRDALRSSLNVLKEGRVLGLAPEGTRSHNGILQKGHDGAAWLAGRTDSTIIPVAMWGHENVTSGWARLCRPNVHFYVGEPYHLPEEARRARAKDLEQYTDMIMRNIALLLPVEQRGPYA